jgi:hypothetical protein
LDPTFTKDKHGDVVMQLVASPSWLFEDEDKGMETTFDEDGSHTSPSSSLVLSGDLPQPLKAESFGEKS